MPKAWANIFKKEEETYLPSINFGHSHSSEKILEWHKFISSLRAHVETTASQGLQLMKTVNKSLRHGYHSWIKLPIKDRKDSRTSTALVKEAIVVSIHEYLNMKHQTNIGEKEYINKIVTDIIKISTKQIQEDRDIHSCEEPIQKLVLTLFKIRKELDFTNREEWTAINRYVAAGFKSNITFQQAFKDHEALIKHIDSFGDVSTSMRVAVDLTYI